MVILIGGESHTGKTLMAQKLLEKYHFPYTSLDHIKMGLIRGYKNCGFTVLDSDCVISEKLWNVVKGIIQTCVENKQNIILEGCYLPTDKIKDNILCENVISFYLIFSETYIKKHFKTIIQYENVIENRKCPEERTEEDFIMDNQRLKEKCLAYNLKFFEIDDNYQQDIAKAYDYIDRFFFKIRSYTENDLSEIVQLFYDTVHSINAKDYSKQQLKAWAADKIDKTAWHQSLSEHYSIVVEKNSRIVGFGDLDGGYLDRLYVHKDYQHQGIATAIIEKLEQYAINRGIFEIQTHASITAKDFFIQHGYCIVKEQKVQRNGVLLINFIMEKSLSRQPQGIINPKNLF